jgi:WD40 repeat protein
VKTSRSDFDGPSLWFKCVRAPTVHANNGLFVNSHRLNTFLKRGGGKACLRGSERTSSKTSSRIAISPDTREVAIGGRHATIQIVDLRTSQTVKRLLGHTDAVTSLAFSPDGHALFSGSFDKTAREWEPVTGKSVAMIPFPNAVLDLAVSRDGRQLVVGLEDDTYLSAFRDDHVRRRGRFSNPPCWPNRLI